MFTHQAPEKGFLHIGDDRRGTDHDTLDRDELIDVYATKEKKKTQRLRSLPLLFFVTYFGDPGRACSPPMSN
jgi:hypothetical protein